MPNRRTRSRQLAKLAARRASQRRRQRRQRIVAAVLAIAVAVGGGVFAFVAFTGGGNKKPEGSSSPKPSASATPSPGTQTGTVTPQPAPQKVACGASAPPEAGKPKPQYSGPPSDQLVSGKRYIAGIDTSCGRIVVELDSATAPQTVNSFVFLAQNHFFDGQYFHRLDTSIDVIQGGDPLGTGKGGPGYSIPDELTGNESYAPGVIAMANGGPNTGGSQFFIITGPRGHNLDANPNYTIFGHVTRGLDVAKKIQHLPIQDPAAAKSGDLSGQQPKKAVYINFIKITVKAAASTSPTPSASAS